MNYQSQWIAEKYNQGLSLREICNQWTLEFPEERPLTYSTLRRKIKKMKDNGTIDNLKNLESEEELLEEALGDVEEQQFMKTGFIDIETTGLTGEFGYVLCVVIKDAHTGEYDIIRLDETKQYNKDRNLIDTWMKIDYDLLIKCKEAMEKYRILVHYNGRNFDMKMLNTRLIKSRIPILPSIMQLDIFQLAKHKLRLRIKSLDSLAEFLDIGDKEKGHNWAYWQMAGNGQRAGFDYVVEHCKKDVDRLERVSKRMEVFVNYMR